MSVSCKGGWVKSEERKGCCPFKSPQSYLRQRDEALHQVGSFNSSGFLPLCTSMARSSSQSRDPCYLEGKVLSAHPGSHCVVSCSRNTCTAACQVTRWWGMSSWYCAENCNWTRWKFTVSVLPWKVQFFRVSKYIRFCQYSYCSHLESYILVLPTPSSPQKLLSIHS